MPPLVQGMGFIKGNSFTIGLKLASNGMASRIFVDLASKSRLDDEIDSF